MTYTRKMLHNFGSYPYDIYLPDILKILEDNNVLLSQAYISLEFEDDHDENPTICLYSRHE